MRKFLPRTTFNPQGFTLIELMIVIAIIAVLSVIAVAVFGNAQKGARDSRRKGDIQALANAYEQTFVSGTGYRTLVSTDFGGGTVPVDPANTGTNVYTSTIVGTSPNITAYTVCAKLEATTGGNSSNNTGTASSNGQFFCMKNQQQ